MDIKFTFFTGVFGVLYWIGIFFFLSPFMPSIFHSHGMVSGATREKLTFIFSMLCRAALCIIFVGSFFYCVLCALNRSFSFIFPCGNMALAWFLIRVWEVQLKNKSASFKTSLMAAAKRGKNMPDQQLTPPKTDPKTSPENDTKPSAGEDQKPKN